MATYSAPSRSNRASTAASDIEPYPPLLGQRGGVEAGQERMLREEHPSHPLVRAPGIAQMRYHLDGEPLAGVRALAGLLVGCSRTRARRVTSVAR